MTQRTLRITGVLCLLLVSFGLLVAAQLKSAATTNQSPARVENQDASYIISGPYTHKNLTIFLVHGKDLITGHSFITLQEALAQKKVIVYETKDVNELAIRNLSNQDVYVQSGDIVRGGDQDRMISMDFIVPPKSGRMPIAAFCVESGRWSRRGNEVNASFASSDNAVSTKQLKLAAKSENSQQAVWENVAVAQDKLSKNLSATVNAGVSRSSLELSLENPKVKETVATYTQALANLLKNKKDVIGYVFAINGQVNSADVYASGALFAKLWPKLLKSSAVEAIAELDENTKAAPVKESAVNAFLVGPDKPSSQKDVTHRVRLLTRESDDSVFFETRDRQKNDAWIHRNYIKK
jgi:hypothetical protein